MSVHSKKKICSICSGQFICGNTENEACWCNEYPAIFTPDAEVDCYCPKCLKAETIRRVEDYVSSLSPEQVLYNKARDLPKASKLIEDLDYYIEDGKFVFKAFYHLKRGYCCNSGCRHCPY